MSLKPFPYKAPNLTFRQFAERLRSRGFCSVQRIEDPTGTGTEVLYRFVKDTIDIIEYIDDDSWPMMASTFRSLCTTLGINPDDILGFVQ